MQILFFILAAYNLLSIPASILWKKKHYRKQVYIDRLVGPIFLVISYGGIILLGWYCLFPETTKSNEEEALVSIVFLAGLTFLLATIFLYFSTMCIFFEDGVLYKKSFWGTRKLRIDQNTRLSQTHTGYIVQTDDGTIEIDGRHVIGDFWTIYNAVKDRINE